MTLTFELGSSWGRAEPARQMSRSTVISFEVYRQQPGTHNRQIPEPGPPKSYVVHY